MQVTAPIGQTRTHHYGHIGHLVGDENKNSKFVLLGYRKCLGCIRSGTLFSFGYSEKDIRDIQNTKKTPNTKSYRAYLLHHTTFYGN